MDRRAFVRLVGGGVVVAAAAPLAGCSSAIPPEAVAAWSGAGNETDLRRWIVAHAILAPHSHNLQSWLVDLRTPDEIVLRCDRGRLLPVTDPYSRQIMMSHGTFLELLVLAARQRGQRAEVTLFPEGAFDERTVDDRPVARVRLVPDASLAPDPLFAQVLKRRTNRNAYDAARPVPAQAWQALAAAMAVPDTPAPLAFGHIGPDDAAALQRHRAIASQAWKIELTTPAAMLESFKVLRVGAREIAEHRDGLSLTSPMVVAMTKLGLFDRSQAPRPDSYATTSQLEDFDRKIATTPGFLWITSQGNDRATQVNAGRAYVRVQLAGTALGLAMHPLQQALQEYPEQAGPHAEIHALLGAPRPTHTVQMWSRVGHAEPVGPAPRRGLDAHLV
ncbi:MAG: twin-arginine translocation pathway signal protein [Rubrivivax sp.]|nr:twin-arginine translocation pathway signal protein [Rubrivivax sp.]